MATTLTLALMDAPYENARSTTALRLVDLAVKRGFNVNVFAYEGAVYLPFAKQAQHANAVRRPGAGTPVNRQQSEAGAGAECTAVLRGAERPTATKTRLSTAVTRLKQLPGAERCAGSCAKVGV